MINKGDISCNICNGTGTIINEFGLKVECDCVERLRKKKDLNTTEKESTDTIKKLKTATLGTRETLVKAGLIPERYINIRYSFDITKMAAKTLATSMNLKVKKEKLDESQEVIETLIGLSMRGELSKQSYILGMSTGFGKSTLVYDLISNYAENGMSVAPYISLMQAANLMCDNTERVIRTSLRKKEKEPMYMTMLRMNESSEQILGVEHTKEPIESTICKAREDYSWNDLLNVDFLALRLTSLDENSMWVEMSTLKTILDERAINGKPTLVTLGESLDWYRNHYGINKYILPEILEERKSDYSSLDRVRHVSFSLLRSDTAN